MSTHALFTVMCRHMNCSCANSCIVHSLVSTQVSTLGPKTGNLVAQESKIIPDEKHARALSSLLSQIQTYTDKLFIALRSAWIPDCHPSHEVALFLDTPVIPKIGHPSPSSSFRFRLMMCGKSVNVAMSTLWHHANVTVVDSVTATQNE